MEVIIDKVLVPALRFPEFTGSWCPVVLRELIANIDAGWSPLCKEDVAGKDEWGVLKTTSVTWNGFDENENKKLPKKLKPRPQIEVNDGDILITRAGPLDRVGVIAYAKKPRRKLMLSDKLIRITLDSQQSGEFISIVLRGYQVQRQLLKVKSGLAKAQANISQSIIKKLDIAIPSKKEQQKIAAFLTAVDTKIQQLKRKHSLMQQYKKGVMQQLFSQQVRFKDKVNASQGSRESALGHDDGRDYPDWEEKRLGDVAAIYDGTHSTPKYTETGVPFYSVEHVTANDFSITKFISEEVFAKENKRVRLEKNDILMTRIGDIGTSVILSWDVRASFYVSLALIKQSSYFDSSYLHQYISSVGFQKELFKRTIHVAFPKKINLGEIGNCFISLPCLEEQRKIAEFLGSIDTKITQLDTQITQAETFKKGLLQQMFV